LKYIVVPCTQDLQTSKKSKNSTLQIVEGVREGKKVKQRVVASSGCCCREQSIREMVKRRDVSGSTKSVEGQKLRDGLATIKQTCRKLGLSLYHFMRQHFDDGPPDLSNLVRQRYQSAS
jgi:hypothetical protein